jgi:mannonate dehydratase
MPFEEPRAVADTEGVRIGVRVNDLSESSLRQLRQLGAEDALVELPPARDGDGMPSVDRLEAVRDRVEGAGLRFAGIHTLPSSTFGEIMFGTDGADAQLEAIETLVRNLGAVGVPLLGYNWALRVVRTGSATVRGGAEATAWRADGMGTGAPTVMDGAPSSVPSTPPDEEAMWEHYARFVERIVPVAEAADVRLAVHPTDPPHVEAVDGVPRLLRSVEAFDRAMDLSDSRYHAIKLCLGCFAEMGADIPEVIRHFGDRDRIGFVHFRNVVGTVPEFHETFVDEGRFDPAAAMRALHDVGFESPVLPDHVPDVENDPSTDALLTGGVGAYGYTLGYLRALRDAVAA